MAGLIGNWRDRMFPAAPNPYNPSEINYHPPSYEDTMNAQNARRVPQTVPGLTPYLGARSRLSQVWFNRWTVLLMLILVRIILASISLDNDLESAREKAFSACTGVESMGTAMASMPFYMANGVNDLTAKSIEAAVRALEQTLLLMITGVQEIVVFVVNMITSTYLCLITLAVRGSIEAMVSALKEITDFVNKTMTDVFDSANNEITSFEDALNKIAKSLESIPNFFGKQIDFPTLDLPSLNKLKDGLTIPDDFVKKLDALNNSMPTFQEVKDAANDAIRIPFQLLTKQVNSSLGIYEFDRSVFPVPQKEKMTFCSDNPSINNFFDNLVRTVLKVKNILMGVIIVLAILAMVPMTFREWRTYRTTRSTAYLLSDPDRGFDPVDVVCIASAPNSQILGLKFADRFKSHRRQVLVRWAISYVTSPPALFVLSLGIAGLWSVLCQYILLKQVEAKAPGLAAEVGEFAGMVVDKLNNASAQWAIQSNKAINATNTELNQELFGWVKEGSDSLNNTLNTFVDTMHDGVSKFLLGSPLANAVNDVLDCLITLKIQGIQKALTWAHDNAHVSLPTLPEDVFSKGAQEAVASDSSASSFLANPGSAATDQITNVVVKLTDKWEAQIRQEAIISTCIVCIWLFVVLIAIVRTLALWWGRDLPRGEGGPAPLPHVFTGRTENVIKAPPPAFPTFGTSPNTPCGPPSPEEYPNEKIHMGNVNSGRTNTMDTVGDRRSYHPSFSWGSK